MDPFDDALFDSYARRFAKSTASSLVALVDASGARRWDYLDAHPASLFGESLLEAIGHVRTVSIDFPSPMATE